MHVHRVLKYDPIVDYSFVEKINELTDLSDSKSTQFVLKASVIKGGIHLDMCFLAGSHQQFTQNGFSDKWLLPT